jgi:hypothetical protein
MMVQKQIKFIQRVGFSGAGFVTQIIEETENYLYYYDECDRWCSIPRKMEGVDYILLGAIQHIPSPLQKAYKALDGLYQIAVIEPTVADDKAEEFIEIIRGILDEVAADR